MGTASIASFLLVVITGLLVLATLGLVSVTAGLVGATLWQVLLSRRALDLSIRPLLADPSPLVGEPPVEEILFGAPGRQSRKVHLGALWIRDDGSQISLPFRNVGSGVAVITDATTEPPVDGSVYVTRKFVPQGEHVRVNISRSGMPGSKVPTGQWWAMEPFAVLIHYTDAAGRQALISRADFRQAATQGPWVSTISVFEKGNPRPFAVGRSSV